jgi:hypothetical protein
MAEIDDLFWAAIKRRIISQSVYAKVVKINDNQTIDCVDIATNTEYKEVQLTATETKDSFILVTPKVGSTVVVSFLNNVKNDAYVNGFSELEKLEITIEETIWNGGKKGGLVQINELKENMESLKSYCEQLKTAIASGISAVGVGVAANGGTGASAFNSAMSSAVIDFKDMEDTKFKH